jgi:hypothetical protein
VLERIGQAFLHHPVGSEADYRRGRVERHIDTETGSTRSID